MVRPMKTSVVWLRRDLRLNDHAALHAALSADAPVQAVFVFDKNILERFSNPHDRRLTFLAETLHDIHAKLQAKGGGLLVLYGSAQTDIVKLAKALDAQTVFAAEDYEPATQARDAAVAKDVTLKLVTDHVIHRPGAVLKDDDTPYKVFTPFSKRWRAALDADSYDEKPVKLDERLRDYPSACKLADEAGLMRLDVSAGPEAMLKTMGYARVSLGQWNVQDVQARLERFTQASISGYKETRDFPAQEEGTSRLSPYLRHGLISVRECCRLASLGDSKGHFTWVNEIIWREFYHHILFYFPNSINQEFQAQYRDLEWNDNAEWLARWKEGKTGYPIVDAAMRELLETGYMHNRARMIVASFFTKDLHLDWRLGEEHFAKHLMDYELSSNVGGWQWAASTGTDAQPYFRIFNPELQSKRFDPEGAYIKRYVPELRGLNASDIHAPQKAKDLFAAPSDYPEPIVDHHVEKGKAIAMFKREAS
jgi:deoxyribodipyrimidine photo-lyase